MKRLVSAFILLVSAAVFAETCTIDDRTWTYSVRPDGTAVIEGAEPSDGAVNIPSAVDGIVVSAIGESAFMGSNVAIVKIPETVVDIGEDAFRECETLNDVVIPDSVEIIRYGTFSDCLSLQRVIIPEGVRVIQQSAFSYCSSLETVAMPSTITNVGYGAFRLSSQIKRVDIASLKNWLNIDFSMDGANPLTYGADAYVDGHCLTNLVIEGSREKINDYAFTGCKSIKTLVISGAVRSIGSYAFCDCENIETLVIPSGVRSIGASAFSGCKKLPEPIVIPDSVEEIGVNAFGGCNAAFITIPAGFSLSRCGFNKTVVTNVVFTGDSDSISSSACEGFAVLKRVVIPDSVKTIESYAFNSCHGLVDVRLPDELQTIEKNAFSLCESMTTLTLPEGVEKIGEYAFYSCTGITAVVAGCKLSSVGWNAFSSCRNIKTVVIPPIKLSTVFPNSYKTITNLEVCVGAEVIPTKVFEDCAELVSVEIPLSVTNVEDYAFKNCQKIRHVEVPGGLKRMAKLFPDSYRAITTAIVLDGSDRLIDYLFASCTALSSVCIPDSVVDVGYEAFWECEELNEVVLPECVTNIASRAFEKCSGLMSFRIPSGVRSIARYTFYSCKGLKVIDIPEGVTNLESDAFEDCIGLESVTLPLSMKNVDSGAFDGCENICSVTCPGHLPPTMCFSGCPLTNVAIAAGSGCVCDRAFANCETLRSVVIPNGVTNIGAYVLRSSPNLRTLHLPDGLIEISDYAFLDAEIEEINMPSSLQKIGKSAFVNCKNLRHVSIPCGVMAIQDHAFGGCEKLEEVIIACGVEEIGPWAFYRCFQLREVVLPKSVQMIGEDAFLDCTGLVFVSVNCPTATIGSHAFSGCTQLQNVVIPGGAGLASFDKTALTNVAFTEGSTYVCNDCCRWHDKLLSVEIPNGVTNIGAYAFYGCSSLTSIAVPASVRSIGSAFDGCTGLKEVRCESIEDWCKIEFSYGGANPLRYGAKLIVEGKLLEQLEIPITITKVNDYSFMGYIGLRSVVGHDGLLSIGASAFYGCKNLAEVRLYNSLTNINGWAAFADCPSIRSVTIPDCVRSVQSTFGASYSIMTNAVIADGVEKVRASLFSECSSLTSVGLPQSVKDIETYAFYRCRNLVAVDIPQGVTNIDEYAFRDCSNLQDVSIPACVKSLAKIFPASTLLKVEIKEGRQAVESDLFKGCSGVATVKLPTSLERIEANAFADCRRLSKVDIGSMSAWEDIRMENENANPLSGSAELFINGERPTEIVVPAGVEKIDAYRYAGCSEVARVCIPASVKYVDKTAFARCPKIQSVSLPGDLGSLSELFPESYATTASVEVLEGRGSLRNGFWRGCTMLTRLILPESLTDLGDNNVQEVKELLGFSGSGLWVRGEWLMACIGEAKGVVVIPNGVKRIAPYAFEGQWQLDAVCFPEELVSIGDNAFKDCTGLEMVEFPKTLESIGNGSFRNCTWVSEVKFGDGLLKLGDSAFANCSQLTRISLPEALEEIGTLAFSNCWNVLSVSMAANVKSIGYAAFADCKYLTGVKMPVSIRPLKEILPASYYKLKTFEIPDGDVAVISNAFKDCEALESLILPNSLTNIGNSAFMNCRSLRDIGIGSGVETLGNRAFSGCSELVEIGLPQSLRTIEDYAFEWCVSVTNVALPAAVRELGRGVFYGCQSMKSLYCLCDAPAHDVYVFESPYGGLGLMVYVAEGTVGWDGVPKSRSLPEQWPTDAVDSYCKRPIAHWAPKKMTITYDVNGGEISVPTDVEQVVGTAIVFPQNIPTRYGYSFVGWWTERDGGAQVQPGSVVTAEKGFTLYAHWVMKHGADLGLGDYLNDPGRVFNTDTALGWLPDADVSSDGFGSVRSGSIGLCQTSQLWTVVQGAGKLCFNWKVSCEEPYKGERFDYLALYVDDVEVGHIEGEVDWCPFDYIIETGGEHKIMWRYVKDDYDYPELNCDDCAWVDEFAWVRDPDSFSIAECLNAPDLVFSCSEGFEWTKEFSETHDGEAAVRSCQINDDQECWIETSVGGKGNLSFAWKVCGEENRGRLYDYATCEIDGVVVASSARCDWSVINVDLSGDDSHVVRWKYHKDSSGSSEDGDCVFLDEVKWMHVDDEIPELPMSATAEQVKEALEGSQDARLTENVTDAATYNAYREWALKIGATDVKASPFAWVSFATDSAALLAKMPTDEDLKVEEFKPSAMAGSFDFAVSVKDVKIGDKASVDNLKKLFGLEGAESLDAAAFSSENVSLDFKEPQDGKLKFSATPAVDNAKSFFMKAKVK